jgi:ATP/maltotriose-dependent transcriptional regulator MalT
MPILAALIVLFCADRFDRAASWCDSLFGSAEKQGDAEQSPVWQALLAVVRMAISYRQGNLTEAEARGRQALHLLPPESWGAAIAAPLAFMVFTATAMGKYRQAAAYLNVHVPPAAFQTSFGPHYLSARGHFYLATGLFDAALHDFEACGELMSGWGFDSPAFVPWRTDAAEAYISQNMIGPAGALVKEQLTRLRPGQSRTRGITLRAQAATIDIERRVRVLRDAAKTFQLCGDRLGLAYTLADLSQTHHVLGEYRLADAMARSASRLADQCGAEPLKRRLMPVPDEPGEDAGPAGGPVDSPSLMMLSDAEKKVATLAAEGHTNRQISHRLHITVSTVEQHLTRVYRKLDVSQRSELRSRLSGATSQSPRVGQVWR